MRNNLSLWDFAGQELYHTTHQVGVWYQVYELWEITFSLWDFAG